MEQVLKHKIDNIKRMSSHPLMPLYLTGGQDGSVQMWEWGHQQAVCTPRPPGTFAKGRQISVLRHESNFHGFTFSNSLCQSHDVGFRSTETSSASPMETAN